MPSSPASLAVRRGGEEGVLDDIIPRLEQLFDDDDDDDFTNDKIMHGLSFEILFALDGIFLLEIKICAVCTVLSTVARYIFMFRLK